MIGPMHDAPRSPQTPALGEIKKVPIFNTSYTGFGQQELNPGDMDYQIERERVLANITPEGVHPLTPEQIEEEKAIDKEMMKKVTSNIFTLDFTSISFPVAYSEQRSFLERTADRFTFIAFPFADRAYNCKDPPKRLALITAGLVAGFHLCLQSKKPWNPVLGETYVGRWPNGTTLYAEQISHHPPISQFQIFGEHYTCDALCTMNVKTHVSKIEAGQSGCFHLNFDDGTRIEFELPTITVNGVQASPKRTVQITGPISVIDMTNKLEAYLIIQPKKDPTRNIPDKVFSYVFGGIRPFQPNTKEKAKFEHYIQGDYLQSLMYDQEEIWNLSKDIAQRPLQPIQPPELLPSDSRFRLDRLLFIQNDLVNADKAKIIIEGAQRREEKLRNDHDKQVLEEREEREERERNLKENGDNEKKTTFGNFTKPSFFGKFGKRVGSDPHLSIYLK